MKVIRLETNPKLYSGNSYLLLGSWNKIDDVNTLIDTGSDDYILKSIAKNNTGVGKRAVDQVIITHSHFDHVGAVKALKEKYNAKILSFSYFPGVDRLVKNGELIKAGDDYLEIFHTPGHSYDSICIYNKKDEFLFSGDTTIFANDLDATYTQDYIDSMEKMMELELDIIYPGHGEPINNYSIKMAKSRHADYLQSKKKKVSIK